MAIIPIDTIDDPEMQVTNLDSDVLVITNPGRDNEEVLYRFDIRDRRALEVHLTTIRRSIRISEKRKPFVFFWIGYFYAHLVRQ